MRERTVLRCNDVVNDMRNDNGSRGNGFQPFNPPNRGRQQGGMRQSNFRSEQSMGYDNSSVQFAGNACGFPPCSGCRCECTYYGATGPTLWGAGMTPDTIPWTLCGAPYYDSVIIYYAVGN